MTPNDPFDHWHTESCGKGEWLAFDGTIQSPPCDCGLDDALGAFRVDMVLDERQRIWSAVRGINPDDYADGDDARTAVNILDRVLDLVVEVIP